MKLICVVVLLSAGGYRQDYELEGTWVKDSGDYYYVDFEEEFKKRKISTEYNTIVQRVRDNACMFKEPPPKL
jgi:hypothetical protein